MKTPELPILLSGGVTCVRYYDREGVLQALIAGDETNHRMNVVGQDLRDFRVLQTLDENPDGPEVLKYIEDTLLIATYHQISHPITLVVTVAKVTCNKDDSIRAIYTSVDAEVPLCLITAAWIGEGAYREADAGKYLYLFQNVHNSRLSLRFFNTYVEAASHASGTPGAPEGGTRLMAGKHLYYREYVAKLVAAREQLIQAYVESHSTTDESVNVGLFKFQGNTASYSDTVITFESMEDATKVITLLHRAATNDFQKDLHQIVATCTKPIKVNGTSIYVDHFKDGNQANRYRVNGKLLTTEDYLEVVDRVTCYPDDQEGYDAFVALVAKMSLKYHRLVQDGVKLAISISSFFESSYSSHMNMKSSSSVKLLMRKPPRKHLEVFWLGKWRRIMTSKQDSFVTFATSNEYRWRHGLYYSKVSYDFPLVLTGQYVRQEDSDALRKDVMALSLVSLMDLFLEKEDVVLQGDLIPASQNKDRLRELSEKVISNFKAAIDAAEAVIQRSKELFDEVCDTPKVTEGTLKKLNGYIVQGESGKVYFVDKASAGVYDNTTGNHICIVNGGANTSSGYDYLTSVISALLSDKYTARAITTLKV